MLMFQLSPAVTGWSSVQTIVWAGGSGWLADWIGGGAGSGVVSVGLAAVR